MKNWYQSKNFIKSRTFIVVNTKSGPFIFSLRDIFKVKIVKTD